MVPLTRLTLISRKHSTPRICTTPILYTYTAILLHTSLQVHTVERTKCQSGQQRQAEDHGHQSVNLGICSVKDLVNTRSTWNVSCHTSPKIQELTVVRRKHSRQNKEIITYVSAFITNIIKADTNSENVRHKTAMKVLTDEIGVLKEEIMEVKQINRILSLQMKKMKEDQKKSCSPVRSCVLCGKRADK